MTIESAEERLTELLTAASGAVGESSTQKTSTSVERLLEVLLKLDLSGAARPLPPAVAARLSLLLLDAFSRACRSEDPVSAAERWTRLYEAAFGQSGLFPKGISAAASEDGPATH